MNRLVIKRGDKFNRLTAIRFDHRNKKSEQYWLFRCNCGNEIITNAGKVSKNKIKSCGCLAREISSKVHTTHGMTHTPEYETWHAMKARCLNKRDKRYKDYGLRGIKVCKRWIKFENFYKDMGKRPKDKTLDRIDNDNDYKPSNCHWATMKEQGNNRRTNHLLTYNKRTQNVSQWASDLGINRSTLSSRIYKQGWLIEKALATPVIKEP